MTRSALVLATLAALGTAAHAEDIVAYQASGDAPASGADARTMALDEAFASAVAQALGELVTPETRTARKGELDKEIVGRARLWVAKFSVTKDETNDDRRELSVSVRIDRDKLRARLGELNVPTRDVVATTNTPPSGTEAPPPPAKTVTVLVRVAQADGAKTSFGDGATADLPGVSALTNVLRAHGYAVRKAPTGGSTGRREGDLPLSDDEAAALAVDAKADSFVVAGVSVADPVPVRGRTGSASLVTAKVRLVERKDTKAVGEGQCARRHHRRAVDLACAPRRVHRRAATSPHEARPGGGVLG